VTSAQRPAGTSSLTRRRSSPTRATSQVRRSWQHACDEPNACWFPRSIGPRPPESFASTG
jgi:hypothetical protein